MRLRWKTLFMGTAAALCLSISAGAVDYTVQADALKEMGLFRGTQTGYALDRAPTRAEAAVMLTRLLGQEEAALAHQSTVPFQDLNGWEAPYVAYLYENGYTTGTSAETFSPDVNCDVNMYSAFLLRALGYSQDMGDFSYESVLNAASEKGLYEKGIYATHAFLRDDMVVMSYAALAAPIKSDGQTMLIEKLAAQGALQGEAGQKHIALAKTYRTYSAAASAMQDRDEFTVQGTVNGKKTNATGVVAIETSSENTWVWNPKTLTMRGQETLQVQAANAEPLTIETKWNQIGTVMNVQSDDLQYTMSAVSGACGYRVVPFAFVQSVQEQAGAYEVTCQAGYFQHCYDIFGVGASALGLDETSTNLSLKVSQKLGGGAIQEQVATVHTTDQLVSVTSTLKMQ